MADQRASVNLNIQMQVRPVLLIILLRRRPVRDRLAGKADNAPDTILRNTGKSGNVNNIGYTVHILKPGDPRIVLPVLQP